MNKIKKILFPLSLGLFCIAILFAFNNCGNINVAPSGINDLGSGENGNTETTTDVIGFEIGTGFDNIVNAIVVQPDGKILVGGSFTTFNNESHMGLVRLNSDGTLDTSFDIGTGFFDSSNNGPSVRTLALQPSGSSYKIIVAGLFGVFNGEAKQGVVRLNLDGSIDSTFSSNVTTDVFTSQLLPNGKILTAGSRIRRLNTDGTLDATFNIGAGTNSSVWSLGLQPDGKILAGGSFTSYDGQTHNGLVRLNANGTVDSSFEIGTGFVHSISQPIISSLLAFNGKIYVGGQFTSYDGTARSNLIRLNLDGTEDATFTATSPWAIYNMTPDIEENVLVSTFNRIIRISQTGELVSTFTFNSLPSVVTVQSNGKILAGGHFTSYGGVTYNRLIRLNTDGSADVP